MPSTLSTLSAARSAPELRRTDGSGGGSRPGASCGRMGSGSKRSRVRSTGSGGTARRARREAPNVGPAAARNAGWWRKTTAAAHASAARPALRPARLRSGRRGGSGCPGRVLRAPPARRPAPRPKATAPTEAPTKLRVSGTQVESSPPARTWRDGRLGDHARDDADEGEHLRGEAAKASRRRRRRGPRGRGGCSQAREQPSRTAGNRAQRRPRCCNRRDRRPVEVGTLVPVSRLRIGERLRRRSRATVGPDGSPLPWRMRGASPLAPRPHRAIAIAGIASASSSSSHCEYASATAMFI